MPDQPTVNLLHDLSPTLSVGILTANLLSLGSELALLEGTGVRLLHVDVMDGCFCPMMTVGPPFIKALKTSLRKDIHLMVCDPLEKIAEYVAAGADILTIHVESGAHIHRALQQMRDMTNANDPARGIMRGIALNPGTPLEVLEPLLEEVDLVSILAVNPGWRGSFIPSTGRRIARLRQTIAEAGRKILVAVDGGVTRKNVAEVAATGADIIVTGSAVFDGKAPKENAKFMLEAVKL
jgi:ribulose-phosphate 3-epimerase